MAIMGISASGRYIALIALVAAMPSIMGIIISMRIASKLFGSDFSKISTAS